MRDAITITKHRERISELLLQHYTKSEIIEAISQEFGVTLTRRQLDADVQRIQSSWISSMNINYDLMINQELARLDSLESELWRQLRKSSEPKVREIIDRLPDTIKDGLSKENVEYIISRVQTHKETTPVNPVYFSRIIDVQKERRRLLGMYAPKRSEVAMHHTVEVKGYDVISPDDWDNVVEGNVVKKVEKIEDTQKDIPE